jgi:hypothetical protein
MTASAFGVTLTNTAHLYARKRRNSGSCGPSLTCSNSPHDNGRLYQAAAPMYAVAFCNIGAGAWRLRRSDA